MMHLAEKESLTGEKLHYAGRCAEIKQGAVQLFARRLIGDDERCSAIIAPLFLKTGCVDSGLLIQIHMYIRLQK